MPLEILYLLMASSGAYDCYARWVVAAFPTLEAAIAYRDLAAEASAEAIAAYKVSAEGRQSTYVYFDAPTKYDLAHSVRGTSVTYSVEPLPFVPGALDASGLIALVDAYATAQGITREVNHPGISQKLRKPAPAPVTKVKGDFADKLQRALAA